MIYKNRFLIPFIIYDAKCESLKVGFDGSIKPESHGSKVTSDGELLAYRDTNYLLGLFIFVS